MLINNVVTLTKETRWLLALIIFVSNFLFFLAWLSYLCVEIRLGCAKKNIKFFAICCLCCHKHNVKELQLKVLKSG